MYEPNMQDVFDLYQQKIALLSDTHKERLCIAFDEGMSPFVIGCAILRASQEKRRSMRRGYKKSINFNYVYGIIENWLNQGIITEEDFRGLNNKQVEEGRERNEFFQKKVQRKDFTYTTREQDRSRFAFLDD